MRSWRAWGVAAGAAVTTILVIPALLEFLAPDLSYQLRDRGREVVSGDDGSKTDAIRGLAALETQYFFVIVPNASPAQEFRDLTRAREPRRARRRTPADARRVFLSGATAASVYFWIPKSVKAQPQVARHPLV